MLTSVRADVARPVICVLCHNLPMAIFVGHARNAMGTAFARNSSKRQRRLLLALRPVICVLWHNLSMVIFVGHARNAMGTAFARSSSKG